MAESLHAGDAIGEYELVRMIGRGGMAEVWVARRKSGRRASKYVAIKVVSDEYAGNSRYERMFRAEADLAALLNHANIVQVFDEGQENGRSFLVMEWVDGVNLLKVAAALTFVEDDEYRYKVISYIIGQLLYALKYAHSITLHDGNPLGVVHRDVSPQNVLVSAQGEVKLTDFGVAHHLLEESSGAHVKGKIRYMSPEQISGKTRDPRVDLYATGAILHELLDGRRFRHEVEDQRQMYLEALGGTIPALSRPAPAPLDTLRRALLEPEVEDRVPNADAALDLLAAFPGHGDARRELTDLCGALTGVMQPRVGPQQSAAIASMVGPARSAVSAEPRGGSQRVSASEEPAPSTVTSVPRAESGSSDSASAPHAVSPSYSAPLEVGSGGTATLQDAGAQAPVEVEPTEVMDSFGASAAMSPEPTETSLSEIGASLALSEEAQPSLLRSALIGLAGVAFVATLSAAGVWWVMSSGVEEPSPEGTVAATEKVEPAGTTESSAEPEFEPEFEFEAELGVGVVQPLIMLEESTDSGSMSDEASTTEGGTTGAIGTTAEEPASEIAAEPEPKAARRRTRSALSVAATEDLGTVEVRIKSKDGSLRKHHHFNALKSVGRLPIGRYSVKWRMVGGGSWNSASFVLRKGCDLRLVIKASGLTPTYLGTCG